MAVRLALVWVLGFNLRSVMLALPPILPLIRHDLHLSYAVVGVLTSIPVVLLGLAAVPGAVLANRYGSRPVVAACLVGMVAGAVARLLPPQLPWLLAGTVVLAASVALVQPSASLIVRAWFTGAVERASALYTAGLSVGGLVAATVTPALAVLLGWRGTFWFWALPVLGLLLFWLGAAPSTAPRRGLRLTRVHVLAGRAESWRIAVLFGAQSLVFYSGVTWVPFQAAPGGSRAVAIALLGLTSGSLVPTLTLAVLPFRYATSRPFYLLGGILMVGGGAAIVWAPQNLLWLYGWLLGAGGGLAFVGSLALPAVLAASPDEIPDLMAFVLTVGYLAAFVGPLLGGALVDVTGWVGVAFLPGIAAGLIAALAGASAPWRRTPLAEERAAATV